MKTDKWAIIIITVLFLTACSPVISTPQQAPEAVEGVLDLREWDFEKDGSINISGEWAFYWGELLQPDQIRHPILAPYVNAPDIWSNYEIEGESFGPEGYATYYLTIYPPNTRNTYGLYSQGQDSAYKLWIDGRLIAENGQVGTNLQAMIPKKYPQTVFFELDEDPAEVVLQISNFHHRNGGFRNNLLLGLAEPVHQYHLQIWFVDAISVGILFIMGLYHFFIYIYRKKNKAPLYFAIVTWMMAIRIGITNQNTLLINLPEISWSLALRVEYLTFFLGPPFFSLFMKSLYPKEIHNWFIRTTFGLGVGFSIFMLFTDTLTFSYTPPYYQIVLLFVIIYYVYFLWQIIANRREGAVPIAIATVIVFATVIIEALSLRGFLPYGQIAPYGFLAYIFVQAILLSSKISRAYNKVESLSTELEESNLSLKKSEKKYRKIFEESKDVIFIARLDTKIEDISPSCEEVLGYTKGELEQMKAHEIMANPEEISGYLNIISDHGAIKNLEIKLVRKDGKMIDALISATLRKDDNGEVIGVQGTVRDITDRKQAQAERLRATEFEQIAITDPLTNIYNRRYFFDAVEKEIERSKRTGSPLSLIIIDIDHFKKINDTYGHLIGDRVLIDLVNLCQKNIRSMDSIARFGGDELVILMPNADMESASKTAEKLREIVANKLLTTNGNEGVSVTISIGVADWKSDDPQPGKTLLDRADQALYQSKKSGRNRVNVWREVSSKK